MASRRPMTSCVVQKSPPNWCWPRLLAASRTTLARGAGRHRQYFWRSQSLSIIGISASIPFGPRLTGSNHYEVEQPSADQPYQRAQATSDALEVRGWTGRVCRVNDRLGDGCFSEIAASANGKTSREFNYADRRKTHSPPRRRSHCGWRHRRPARARLAERQNNLTLEKSRQRGLARDRDLLAATGDRPDNILYVDMVRGGRP